MAVLISKATGNWTTAGTWGVVDSTSYLNSEDGFTPVPNSAGATARSSSFTPGAIQIDAIAVKIYTVTTGGSPDQSLTVNLYNVTGAADVAGTSVTIRYSDIDAVNSVHQTQGNPGGWLVFKFAAPVTLSAATSYAVQCVSSDGLWISLLTDVTANNWSRMLRTTTTKVPNSSSPDLPDDMVVSGEYTGPGTSNSYTVTMDNTDSSIDYGTDTTSIRTPSLAICSKGTLSFGTTAATNYYLKISGWVVVYAGGTLNIGTTGTPMPRDSTAVLEIDNNSATRATGLNVWEGGTFVAQGQSRTSGKNVTFCLLTADTTDGGWTTLNVDRDTGWLTGDRLVISPAVQYNRYENIQLTANAGASSLTVRKYGTGSPDLPTDYQHLGTNSPLINEVINLTRNVRVRSSNSTNRIGVDFYDGSVVDIDWIEFQYTDVVKVHLGRVTTKAVNFSMQFSSLYESRDSGLEWVVYTSSVNFTITNLVFSNNVGHSPGGERWLFIDAPFVPTNWTVDSNVVIAGQFFVSDLGGTFTNNRASGNGSAGFTLQSASIYDAVGTFNNLYSHANNSSCFLLQSINAGPGSTFSNLTGFHAAYGINSNLVSPLTIDTAALAGCSAACIYNSSTQITYKNITMGGTSYQATNVGYYAVSAARDLLENSSISVVSGVYTACNYDAYCNQATSTFRNVTLAGANEFFSNAMASASLNSFFAMEKVDGIAGNHKVYMASGYTATDATIYRSYAPSVRLAPLAARSAWSAMKLESAPRRHGIKVPVSNGMALTASIWVRMSTAGDGTAYDGSGPRLVVRSNPAVGIMGDMVLATVPIVGASPDISGTWRQLIGTTQRATDDGAMEFIVDIDGTAGWVNIDDFQFAEVNRSDYLGPGDVIP